MDKGFVSPTDQRQTTCSPERAGRKGERRAAVDSREHLSLDGEGKRDDEDHEQSHLCHE